jgi:thioredoxin 1
VVRSWPILIALAVLAAGIVVTKLVTAPSSPSGPVAVAQARSAGPAPRAEAGGAQPLPAAEFAAALRSGKPTLVDFGAGTCAQCKKQAPILAEAAGRYRGKANVVYIDVATNEGLVQQYAVKFIPYQIFFDKDGKKVSDHVGLNPAKDIAAQFAKLGAK